MHESRSRQCGIAHARATPMYIILRAGRRSLDARMRGVRARVRRDFHRRNGRAPGIAAWPAAARRMTHPHRRCGRHTHHHAHRRVRPITPVFPAPRAAAARGSAIVFPIATSRRLRPARRRAASRGSSAGEFIGWRPRPRHASFRSAPVNLARCFPPAWSRSLSARSGKTNGRSRH
jgi:hypothetical protein